MKSPGAAQAQRRETSSLGASPGERAPTSLSAEESALFAAVGRARRTYAGEVLFRRGDLGTAMYVIVEGAIDLDFGDDLITKPLGVGEFFGELGLLIGDHARSADAIAPVDGVLIELRHEEFQHLVDRSAGLVSHFLRRAIMRVVLNEQALIRRLRRRNQELQTALDSLRSTTHQLSQTEVLIRTDELTGVANRRGLAQHLQEVHRSGALGGLGLVLVDCDRFKDVNDEHGHLAGDRVLQAVANVLRSVAGAGDLVCRLGGDEFCLLVHADSRASVMRYADFVVATAQQLVQLPSPGQRGQPPRMCTLSLGACLISPGGDWSDWYAHADAALYRAKRLGGNCVQWQRDAPASA